MERSKKGLLAAIVGMVFFVTAALFLLPSDDAYLLALVLMFVGVVMIGAGAALAKGFDKNLDLPSEECYFCGGTGIVDSPTGRAPCPRCGGTGIAPDAQTTTSDEA
ncbi:MAG: hypothetical protein ACTSPE_04470 [Candidatus Thorarchaeota archaeon]